MKKIIHDKINQDNFIMDASQNLLVMGAFFIEPMKDKIQFSDEFINMFHLSDEDSKTDMSVLISKFVEFENGKTYRDVISEIMTSNTSVSFEARINRRDGSVVWVLVNGLYDRDNEKINGRVIDVTSYRMTLEQAKGSITFLESLFELIPYPVYYSEIDGSVVRANQKLCEFLGMSEDQLLNYSMEKLIAIDPDSPNQDLNDDELMARGNQIIERRLTYKDESIHTVIFNRTVMRDDQGNPDGILGVIVDITEKTRLQERLKTHNMVKDVLMNISNKVMDYKDENELFQDALESYVKISKTTDFGTVLKIVGDTFQAVAHFGYVKEAIEAFRLPVELSFIYKHAGGSIQRPGIIQNVHDFYDTDRDVDFVPLEEEAPIQSVLYIPLYFDGILQWVMSFDAKTQFYFEEEDLITAEIIKGQIELIVKMFNIYNQAKVFSRYDSLTNLMNRRYFEVVFEEELKLARRNEKELVLVHFDLDDLKGVNDQFGHLVGDDYIIRFTNLLTGNFREADTFGRIGGDEFVGLFYDADLDSLHEKMILLRTLFQSMGVPIEDNREICGAYSFGLASFPADGDSIDELLKVADERMYLFKHKNKRRIQIFNV